MQVWELLESHLLDDTIELMRLDAVVVRDVAEIMAIVHPKVPLRMLDAIHLATFAGLEAGPLFSRDKRMAAAAKMLGLVTVE